jgi:hypothetical protein
MEPLRGRQAEPVSISNNSAACSAHEFERVAALDEAETLGDQPFELD